MKTTAFCTLVQPPNDAVNVHLVLRHIGERGTGQRGGGRLNDARRGLWENLEKTTTRSVPAAVPAGYQIWNPYPTRRNPLGINLGFTPTLVIP
jgi:hypothetical protein